MFRKASGVACSLVSVCASTDTAEVFTGCTHSSLKSCRCCSLISCFDVSIIITQPARQVSGHALSNKSVTYYTQQGGLFSPVSSRAITRTAKRKWATLPFSGSLLLDPQMSFVTWCNYIRVNFPWGP